MSEGDPTKESLIEFYSMSGDGADFKRAAQERREAASDWFVAHEAGVLEDAADAWARSSGDRDAPTARWLRSRAAAVKRGANPNPPD